MTKVLKKSDKFDELRRVEGSTDDALSLKLKKAHLRLMRHKETAWYSGILMSGKTTIEMDSKQCPTAYTDGWNKCYGADFVKGMSGEEVAGVIMHENLHVFLKHIPRHRDLMKDDPMLANIAMDFVVNDVIDQLQDKALCKMPGVQIQTLKELMQHSKNLKPGQQPTAAHLLNLKYRDWSVREVYRDLKEEAEKCGFPKPGEGKSVVFDEHGQDLTEKMSPQELKELEGQINEALQQGGLLAGKFSNKLPRAFQDAMTPDVDWRTELADFVSTAMTGKDEYTWRRFNRRRLGDDTYLPSTYSETIGEIIVAVDMSGSTVGKVFDEFVEALVSLCEACQPSGLRLLWWDTQVAGEQLFTTQDIPNLKQALRPQGGGGAHVGCVSQYIAQKNLEAEACIVFTDGYVESNPVWNISMPTLWMVTQATDWMPPTGKKVMIR